MRVHRLMYQVIAARYNHIKQKDENSALKLHNLIPEYCTMLWTCIISEIQRDNG